MATPRLLPIICGARAFGLAVEPADTGRDRVARDWAGRWGSVLGRYNRAMTPTPPAPVPAALTAEDLARIGTARDAARAPSTRNVYRHCWSQWQRWCEARGFAPLPADPAAVCAYLTERAAAGTAVASLGVACCAIGFVHRTHDLENPIGHDSVRQVRAGLRRTYGIAPQRQARPLTVPEVAQILAAIDRGGLLGARDAALILLGYASALRVSELAALTLADIETQPGGLLLHLARSKTDQDGAGVLVGVAHGSRATTDPISALTAWRHLRGETPGPLFVRLRNERVSNHRLAPHTLSRILHERAEAAGLPAARVTGHSLRAGHATAAYAAGVHLDRIATQTRHKDLSVLLNRYIRPLDVLASTSSRDLGL